MVGEGHTTKKSTKSGHGPTTNNNKVMKVQTQLKPEGGPLPEPQPEVTGHTNQRGQC